MGDSKDTSELSHIKSSTKQNYQQLMYLLEELINFLNREKIQYWIDRRTMLGYIRYGNVMLGDHDCDLGMMEEDYEKLLSEFKRLSSSQSKEEYRIGRFLCLPSMYDNDCLRVKDVAYPESNLGINVIKYKLMTCAESPSHRIITTNTRHHISYDDIFPLKLGFMVGLPVYIPNNIQELVKQQVQIEVAKDAGNDSLQAPFKVMKEFKTLTEGLAFYCSLTKDNKEPFLVRSPPEFLNLKGHDVVSRFKLEDDVLSWHETETELFNDTYHQGAKLYESWQMDKLIYNVVDAPSKHLDLLPPELLDNFKNMSERAKYYAICYAMTKKNNLTKYHQDVLGDGWVYLDCGRKVWHIFDIKDLEYLEGHGYPILSLKDMNFSELVTILDGYLWSKIYVGTMGPKDFIYFPQSWPHRVITYDKSFGICGYTKS